MTQEEYKALINLLYNRLIKNPKATNVMKFQTRLYLLNILKYVEFEDKETKQKYKNEIEKYFN